MVKDIPHPHITPGLQDKIDNIKSSSRLEVKEMDIGDFYLMTSDMGLQYVFRVLKKPLTEFESTQIEFTGPYNQDIFGTSKVSAYFRGSSYGVRGMMSPKRFVQGMVANIIVPYQNLPVIYPTTTADETNVYIARTLPKMSQEQSMGGVISSIASVNELIKINPKLKKEAIEDDISSNPIPRISFSELLVPYLMTEEEITEECDLTGITQNEIYFEYFELQDRYSIGRTGHGRARNVYKYGNHYEDIATINHIMWSYQQKFGQAIAEGDPKSIRFSLLRIAAFDWWAKQLDLGNFR